MNHAARIAKLKVGPGTFVYLGGEFDTECTPTAMRYGKMQPVIGEDNQPVLDRSGRQVFERVGDLVRDKTGRPVMGGLPKMKHTEIEVRKTCGLVFPKGEPVAVNDEAIALRLRGKKTFKEVEPEAVQKPLAELSKKELLSLADNEGIEVPAGSSKADIVAILSGAQAED